MKEADFPFLIYHFSLAIAGAMVTSATAGNLRAVFQTMTNEKFEMTNGKSLLNSRIIHT
jgi:hypothetical protein